MFQSSILKLLKTSEPYMKIFKSLDTNFQENQYCLKRHFTRLKSLKK